MIARRAYPPWIALATFFAASFARASGSEPVKESSAPAKAAHEEARGAFERGERAFAAHDYEAALQHFKRAFALAPHDAVRFNVAVCHERLGQFRAAIAEYTMAAASPQLDAASKLRADQNRARLEPLLATLVVDGEEGTRVLVDGEPACIVPCRVAIDPRPQVVTLRANERERTLRIEPLRGAEIALRSDLPPDPATRAEPAAPLPETLESGAGAAARAASQPLTVDSKTAASVDGRPRGSAFPGLLTYLGGGLTIVAGAGTAIFGLRTQTLHDRYIANPSSDLRSEGLFMRSMTNAAIVTIGVGIALVLVDLLFISDL
jgi:tetratricopeptide repeat protein